MTYWFR